MKKEKLQQKKKNPKRLLQATIHQYNGQPERNRQILRKI